MGGSIRVVHRIGGVIDKQTRWTNSLPGYVQNAKFINGDPEYVKEYQTRPSEWRGEQEFLAPNGYGLDFYDFDKKTIHTVQGYTSYNTIEYSGIFLWLLGKVKSIDAIVDGKLFLSTCTDSDDYFFPHEIRKMWNEGMISGISYTGNYDDSWMEENQKILSKEELGNPTFEELLAMLEHTAGRKRMYADHYKEGSPELIGLMINWEEFGWTIKKYDETSEGLKEIKSNIEADIPLTTEDLEIWDVFIGEREGLENS